MRFQFALFAAFVAAAVAPVLSVPVSGGQATPSVTQPVPMPSSNQTSQVNQTYVNLVDGFLSTLNQKQLQGLMDILEGAMNNDSLPTAPPVPTTSPIPTAPGNSSTTAVPTGTADPNDPEKRGFNPARWAPPPIPTPPPAPSCWDIDRCGVGYN